MLMGIPGGVLGANSAGVGIAFKVSDGDLPIRKANGESYNRVRPAVALEILRQMGWISDKDLEALAVEFGPLKPVTNWRKLAVGEARPAFTLHRAEKTS